MSYFRLYPARNNTLFRYLDTFYSNTSFPATQINPNNSPHPIPWSMETNTGANPIMELQDGRGESILVFAFDFPDWLVTKLQNYDYKCNLKLYDAGTLFNPPINLKELSLKYFTDDFVEGDGYSFLREKAKKGVSNYLYRDSINLWANTTFTEIATYHLNRINEDLSFEVTNTIKTSVLNSTNPRFALSIKNRQNDPDNIYTKYIHSKYTRTTFQPYIEFIFDDVIQDKHYNLIAGESNKVYLLNERYVNFIGTVTVTVTDNTGNITHPPILNPHIGVYYIDITPSMPTSIRDEYITIVWNIDNIDLYRQVIKVINPNQINQGPDLKNLFFYPTSSYSRNIVRRGDIIPIEVISQIRGYGNVINQDFYYKVIGMGEFEMIPWTPVSVYRDRMFFPINTEYFYPENNYEVFIKNAKDNYSITSNLTYKFRLMEDAQSHLRNMSASPYYSREYFFAK